MTAEAMHDEQPWYAGAENVARHLLAARAIARLGETYGELRARLAAERLSALELVLITDEQGHLAGVIPAGDLFARPPEARLEDCMDRHFPVATSDMDQEAAASLALHHDVDALPVIDAAGRPLGIMPAKALLHTLRREHVEDLHVLAGIQRETTQARHAIEDPPLRRARHRLPWLLVGLAGSALTTGAMVAFEETLKLNLAVAFFVPGIVYLANAVGTQSEAIAVRGLSLTRSGIAHLLAGELRTGMVLGAALALVAFPAILLFFHDFRLASAVAIAILTAATVASAIGLGLPWIFARLGKDPALGSGPIGTVVQDFLSLCIYLIVVWLLMS
jgi:magnesium transporter